MLFPTSRFCAATLIGFGCLLSVSRPVFAAFQPVAVSGFNQDIVLNDGDTATDLFDIPNAYSFYAQGTTGSSEAGLPAFSFSSETGSGAQYQLVDFSANNALLLGGGDPYFNDLPNSGTLTFATPGAFSSLYLLTSSANGGNFVSYTINYADNSTVTGQLYSQDWFDGEDAALSGIGRVRSPNSDPFYELPNGNPQLYEVGITTDAAKVINSVSFTVLGNGEGVGRETTAFLGFSGDRAIAVVPETGTGLLLLLGSAAGIMGVALRQF